ncbi:MAG: thiamine diphosphokinase [Candidatus Limiplasma sp.]|nr:thiamine diphosphokinase [Candidatus Limiplasma sp.]
MPTCYIVGAGDFTPRGFVPAAGDLVIAADGGYRSLHSLGYIPDLLLGDFDSLGDVPLPDDLPILRFPSRKDDTDTGLALHHGLERGFRTFALYGCAGGRVDHLLANLQSMARVSRMGAAVRLAAPEYDAWALTDCTLTLPNRPGGTLVSVFCHSEQAEGVTLTGLSYPLSDAALTCDFPLGVSNRRLDGQIATVSVRRGTLLILQGT